MKFAMLNNQTFVSLSLIDIESLKAGMACHIDDMYDNQYFIFIHDQNKDINILRNHPELKDKILLPILPPQLNDLLNGMAIHYPDLTKPRIIMDFSLEKFIVDNNIVMANITVSDKPTLH